MRGLQKVRFIALHIRLSKCLNPQNISGWRNCHYRHETTEPGRGQILDRRESLEKFYFVLARGTADDIDIKGGYAQN